MMKKLLNIHIFVLSLMLFAQCGNEDISLKNTHEGKDCSGIETIIPRSSDMPDVKRYKSLNDIFPSTRSSQTGSPEVCNDESALGSGYRIGNSIIGDYSNVNYHVIDLIKVKSLGSNRILSKGLQTSDRKSFTYSSFEQYADSFSVTKKISSGFSINLGIFKIGRKKLTTEVFKSAFVSSNQSVYGELNLLVYKGQFKLETSTASIKLYARKCLTPEFRYAISSGPIGSIITQFGEFVLTGYNTGGKAFGFYAAKAKSGASYRMHEKTLQDSINASFVWDKKDNVSVELNFKPTNGFVSTSRSNIKETQVQIRTYGGVTEANAVVGPIRSDSLSIDLTDWIRSLSDNRYHTMIDIEDNGIVPISAFVLETNYRYRLEDTIDGLIDTEPSLIEPSVEVVRVFARTSNGEPLYEIAPVLNTRQGDKIVLSDGSYKNAPDTELKKNMSDDVYTSKSYDIAIQKRKTFKGIGFFRDKSMRLDPRFRQPICIRLDNFNENNAFLFIDKDEITGEAKTGYIYMPDAKIALSYHFSIEDEDAVLDDYGIREWVESLTEKKISTVSLSNYYTIVGLN